jgi:hypothetical protein
MGVRGPQSFRSLTSSDQEVNDKDDQKHATDSASYHRAPIIVATPSTEQKQQNDNNQDDIHLFSFLRFSSTTLSESYRLGH